MGRISGFDATAAAVESAAVVRINKSASRRIDAGRRRRKRGVGGRTTPATMALLFGVVDVNVNAVVGLGVVGWRC